MFSTKLGLGARRHGGDSRSPRSAALPLRDGGISSEAGARTFKTESGMSMSDSTLWRDASVLVTGARGFIAGHLCRQLTANGASVHGVSGTLTTSPISGLTWSWTGHTQPSGGSRAFRPFQT